MNAESIQSMGGKARAEALSNEQKSDIARKAAAARWSDKPVEASHKGNFLNEFGIDIDCYVLNDSQKTAVISQRGMGRALGLSAGGSRLPMFLATKAIKPLVGAELEEKLSKPLIFQWAGGGREQPPGAIYGFDVTLLIDICRIIIQAEAGGKLGKRHAHIRKQAHVILNASAKSGIKQLVYALAGYNPTTQEVISAFKAFVMEEARKYEKEFPPDLYEQWQRLYQLSIPQNGKPWNFKHLTVKHVYFPLAKSNGRILQLIKALKSKGGDRNKKLFQFLSELGTRALRMHMGRVLEMAESSQSPYEYERKIAQRFGGQQELELVLPPIQQ
ncbi:MAG TPA: P63C domain-containing protein [Candidatus Acidoferrales bacterium]|jgi:hypothetical protein|nr:P63C domain-containing protein [Candidatus Acidoferrales bacterium]